MSGFQVYSLDAPRDARTIRQRLEARRAELAELISKPNYIDSWEMYQRRVGVLEGIDEALRVCDEVVEKEVEERR